MAWHRARSCYLDEEIGIPRQIDERKLQLVRGVFGSGHLTPFEGGMFEFRLWNIPVGDVTNGLHLTHPFHNSTQTSGRFCRGMYSNPDLSAIAAHIRHFWPDVLSAYLDRVMRYVDQCNQKYLGLLPKAEEEARHLLSVARPNLRGERLEKISKKVAQEQLRMLIPVIFPTRLNHSLSLIALIAMYRVAWTPALRDITAQMKDQVVSKWPELEELFGRPAGPEDEWSCSLPDGLREASVYDEPEVVGPVAVDGLERFVLPGSGDFGPLDLLHFRPQLMDDRVGGIRVPTVRMSLATLGQFQRHRTVHRGTPSFVGGIYVPPAVEGCGGAGTAKEVMQTWLDLSSELPPTLTMAIAPYGAVVEQSYQSSFLALIHEFQGRLCWAAQEEISNLSRKVREGIVASTGVSADHDLLQTLAPPCHKAGKCREGKSRYCGRDRSPAARAGDYFPRRLV